jgi:hypothetical protein
LDIPSGGTESNLLILQDASRVKVEETKTINVNDTSDYDKDTIHIHDNQYRPLTSTTGHESDAQIVKMKFSVSSYHAVAVWKWDTHPNSSDQHKLYHYAAKSSADSYGYGDEDEDDDDDEEDDVCGICRLAFESTCPECKIPGDDCPLSTSPSH